MRYILQSTFGKELSHRRAYLYDTLHLWFTVSKDEHNNYVLTSMPAIANESTLFIVGHNYFVKEYLCDNDIYEKLIVAITCKGKCDFSVFRQLRKKIYLSHLNKKGYADLLQGSAYGFDFDPTESEVLLFNSPKKWSLEERVHRCFTKIY